MECGQLLYDSIQPRTYSEWFQSRPTGHKSAPVCSWLNPQPGLMLHGMWGLRLCPLGVIQSMIALFIPFVSSVWDPLTPFWTWQNGEYQQSWVFQSTYQIGNMDHFFLWWVHKVILQPRHHPQKLTECRIFLVFTVQTIKYMLTVEHWLQLTQMLSSPLFRQPACLSEQCHWWVKSGCCKMYE